MMQKIFTVFTSDHEKYVAESFATDGIIITLKNVSSVGEYSPKPEKKIDMRQVVDIFVD